MKKVLGLIMAIMMACSMQLSMPVEATSDIKLPTPQIYQGQISEPELEFNFKDLLKQNTIADPISLTFNTKDEAVVYVREQMVARADTASVSVKLNGEDATDVLNYIKEHVFDHTGNPVEGDYLHKHFNTMSISYGYSSIDATYNFTFTYHTTKAQEDKLTEEVNKLLTSLNLEGKSDYEKIKLIYDYMVENINYDNANLKDDTYTLKYTAYAALVNKTSVCQGYASLFYRLALSAGVDARIITGDANGPHAWNIVKIGTKYYNLDATWGNGYLGANSQYTWFLKSQASFGPVEDDPAHIRDAEFDSAEFHAKYPMSPTDYDMNHVHNLVETIINEPTCTGDGSKKYTCTCGYEEYVVIPALGHDYDTEFTVDNEPTCSEAGSKSKHCSRCDSKTEITTIEATGHTITTTTTNPTCTKDGNVHESCSKCDYVKDTVIPMLGHDYDTEFTVDKEATCGTAGSKSKHCRRCDATTEVTVIPATGIHNETMTVVTAPTCEGKGIAKYTCKDCEASHEEEIAALGHDYEEEFTVDKEPTCSEAGSKSKHCSRCDATIEVTVIEPTGIHNETMTVVTAPTCEGKGIAKYTCKDCGTTHEEEIAALGHDYDTEFTVDKAPTCSEAGLKSKHCSRCDAVIEVTVIEATGLHEYEETIIKEATCEENGLAKYTCKVCGNSYEKEIPNTTHHYVGTITKEATCKEDGVMTYTCDHCDDEYEEVIEATGHSITTTTTEPTCTKDGNVHEECSKCDYVKDSVIAALGHDISDSWTIGDDTHYHVCKVCNEIFDEENHDENHMCEVCGKEMISEVETPEIPAVGIKGNELMIGLMAMSLSAGYLFFDKKRK